MLQIPAWEQPVIMTKPSEDFYAKAESSNKKSSFHDCLSRKQFRNDFILQASSSDSPLMKSCSFEQFSKSAQAAQFSTFFLMAQILISHLAQNLARNGWWAGLHPRHTQSFAE
jgi:hypothetical protein